MKADKVFCPLCGAFLDSLPDKPPPQHPPGASWNPSWWRHQMICKCGAMVTVTHIEDRPEVGLSVGALCGVST